MAETRSNIPLPAGVWVDLYARSGLPVGQKILVSNEGAADVLLSAALAEPATNSDAFHALRRTGPPMVNDQGDPGAWAFSPNTAGRVNVQALL